MKITRLTCLTACLFTILSGKAQVSLTPGSPVTESFNTLGSSGTWTDNTSLPGWYAAFTNVSSGAITTPATYANTAGGATTSGTLYSMGTSSTATDRTLGCVPSTITRLMLGWRLANTGTEAITNVVLTYDGEQWRRDTSLNGFIAVSYQVFAAGAGSLAKTDGWIAAPDSLTFTPTVTGAAGSLNGNLAENRTPGLSGTITGISLQPGQEIWFKWHLVKVSGGSPMLGIDNIKATVPFGTPPLIGTIPDLTVHSALFSPTNTFTITDAEEGSSSPALATLYAESSNEAVVPSANVIFGGSGENRTVYVIGGGTPGSADVTVTAYDSYGNTGQRTFGVTVLPILSTPPATNTLANTPVSVPFVVHKPDAASSLTVTGSVAAYSSGILATVQVAAAPDGTNFIATVTPVPGATGVGAVILSAGDSTFANTASFAVMVQPDAATVLTDHFDYPPNANIVNSSPGFWVRRSATVQSINFRTHATENQAWIRPKSGADDVSAPFASRPFTVGSGAILYTMFKAQWNLIEDTVPVVGDSSGPFILLAPNPTATADQLLQIATRTNGVPDGSFRLLVSNGTGTYVEHPADLATNITYNIVARYDVDTATSTLWINAASEATAGVTATDSQVPASVSYVSLRQEPDMGHIYLDDLKVIALKKPVITGLAVPPSGQLQIAFTAGTSDAAESFEVQHALTVTATFNTVSATVSAQGNGEFKALVPAAANQGYYRLVRKPLTF